MAGGAVASAIVKASSLVDCFTLTDEYSTAFCFVFIYIMLLFVYGVMFSHDFSSDVHDDAGRRSRSGDQRRGERVRCVYACVRCVCACVCVCVVCWNPLLGECLTHVTGARRRRAKEATTPTQESERESLNAAFAQRARVPVAFFMCSLIRQCRRGQEWRVAPALARP